MLLDKLGKEITPGAFIAYGHALGRCAGLRIGRVLAIEDYHPYGCGETKKRILVQGVDDDWSHRPAGLARTPGRLLYPDRILVLDSVPEPYKTLLTPAV